jgi:inner membrane protein
MLGRRLGKRALAWGALFGILPELDVLIFPFLDSARQLVWHRGPSHSLLVITLGAYLLSPWLVKLWKRDKVSRTEAGGLIFAAGCGHVLLDCLRVEGAGALWPFSGQRAGFNLLSDRDVLIALPLLVAVAWAACVPAQKPKATRGKKAVPLPRGRRICHWGLGLAGIYLLLAVGLKFTASAGFEADLARRGVKSQRRMELPMPYNILLWRSVVDQGDAFWVGYRSVFEFHRTPVRWTVYAKGHEALERVADLRETRTLLNFTDGWCLVRPHAKGAWFGDLRHPEVRIWGRKKDAVDSRLAQSWVVDRTANSERLRPSATRAEAGDEFLPRMLSRILGRRDAWEANPRLAGVAGSLPEFLPVEE